MDGRGPRIMRASMDEFANKRVTVAGLGRFGGAIAAAQWLARQGAKVLVTDKSPAEKLTDSVRQLDGYPITFRLGEHRVTDFTDTDLVVASPAIRPTNEYLVAARAAGVPITTEICLFLDRCSLPVVAVSGTKGKSTTSTLLSLMLQTRYRCWLGGNIGKSLLFDLPKMRDGEIDPRHRRRRRGAWPLHDRAVPVPSPGRGSPAGCTTHPARAMRCRDGRPC